MAERPTAASAGRENERDELRERLEQRYIQALLARGEAVMEGCPVPEHATHIVTLGEDGRLKARRRFISVS